MNKNSGKARAMRDYVTRRGRNHLAQPALISANTADYLPPLSLPTSVRSRKRFQPHMSACLLSYAR